MVASRSMIACLFMLILGLPLPSSAGEFIPLATTCRALDTRLTGEPVLADVVTTIKITGTTTGGADCGVPDTAVGAALNFTITQAQANGHLTVWSSGDLPIASVVNFIPGVDVANAVDVGLGAEGTVLVQPLVTAHLVVDVYGYFAPTGELAGSNTALGDSACLNTTGLENTCLGTSALASNNTGGGNTATGASALNGNTTGNNNTALGLGALLLNTTGASNIAIGAAAGGTVTTGSNNIHIGNLGAPGDADVIRIGTQGIQTSTFVAGIFGADVVPGPGGADVDAVFVTEFGQLGTATSSRRFKDDIRAMDEASEGLGKLRPVVFRYKAALANGPRPLEYGLIAEEVAEIYPELVVRGRDGQPKGVRYHVLPAMLLNEFQRQQRQLESQAAQAREQAARLEAQQRELEELRAQVRALIGARASSRE